MRLWTLHPKYLDSRGLVALWREALLAQAVLNGQTRGYTRHPQLERFRYSDSSSAAIATYLRVVHEESVRRGYHFDAAKIGTGKSTKLIAVTRGQLNYEWEHLKAKLQRRDPARWEQFKSLTRPQPHPQFRIIPGPIEDWEIVPSASSQRTTKPQPLR
ncbi:MAG: DNA lyase [Planctomycetaceae bacterium]|nr:DNA lyase [Planctomycetaceae bacterium]